MAKEDIISYQFQKGVSGNPSGRPKKFITLIKQLGYKNSEVTETILTLLACTESELKELYNCPQATMLEQVIARALKKSLDTGSLYSLEAVLSRAIGKPREMQEVKLEENTKAFTVTVINVDRPFASAENEVDAG